MTSTTSLTCSLGSATVVWTSREAPPLPTSTSPLSLNPPPLPPMAQWVWSPSTSWPPPPLRRGVVVTTITSRLPACPTSPLLARAVVRMVGNGRWVVYWKVPGREVRRAIPARPLPPRSTRVPWSWTSLCPVVAGATPASPAGWRSGRGRDSHTHRHAHHMKTTTTSSTHPPPPLRIGTVPVIQMTAVALSSGRTPWRSSRGGRARGRVGYQTRGMIPWAPVLAASVPVWALSLPPLGRRTTDVSAWLWLARRRRWGQSCRLNSLLVSQAFKNNIYNSIYFRRIIHVPFPCSFVINSIT